MNVNPSRSMGIRTFCGDESRIYITLARAYSTQT